MGLFSKNRKSENTIPLLDDGDVGAVLAFYENGWARKTRLQMGATRMLAANEKALIRDLKKRSLSEDEIRTVIGILTVDMKLHGDDPDEKEIVRKLRLCLKELKPSVGDRETELLPCPACGSWAFLEQQSGRGKGKWSVGCPKFVLNDGVHEATDSTPGRDRFTFFDCPDEDTAIAAWNERVYRYLKEYGMR